MTNYQDAEGNPDWDAQAQELTFSEEDKRLITLMGDYSRERLTLLGHEKDLDRLWRVITVADRLREQLGMME